MQAISHVPPQFHLWRRCGQEVLKVPLCLQRGAAAAQKAEQPRAQRPPGRLAAELQKMRKEQPAPSIRQLQKRPTASTAALRPAAKTSSSAAGKAPSDPTHTRYGRSGKHGRVAHGWLMCMFAQCRQQGSRANACTAAEAIASVIAGAAHISHSCTVAASGIHYADAHQHSECIGGASSRVTGRRVLCSCRVSWMDSACQYACRLLQNMCHDVHDYASPHYTRAAMQIQ